jgi:hypothetical protein
MSGQRVDWRAIPRRYRAWQDLPVWRKVLWLVTRSLAIGVVYVASAAVILWYNAPLVVEGIANGGLSPLALLALFATQPELLLLCLLLLPAIAAAILLPHRPDWSQ